MGHDMVARAKPDPLQHRAQSRGRPNHAILEQIHVRQVPRPRQMAAAGTVARILAGQLRARPRIEYMRATVELIPQRLPVDQPDRPDPGIARKSPEAAGVAGSSPVADARTGQPPFRMTAFRPYELPPNWALPRFAWIWSVTGFSPEGESTRCKMEDERALFFSWVPHCGGDASRCGEPAHHSRERELRRSLPKLWPAEPGRAQPL